MGRQLTMPSGAVVIARSSTRDVTERFRRPIRNAMFSMSPTARQSLGRADDLDEEQIIALLTAGDLAVIDQISDLSLIAMIESWSYDLPVTADSLLDLPYDDLLELRKVLDGETAALAQGVDFTPTPPEAGPTPTAPSNA
jgi:hypothetical protein